MGEDRNHQSRKTRDPRKARYAILRSTCRVCALAGLEYIVATPAIQFSVVGDPPESLAGGYVAEGIGYFACRSLIRHRSAVKN
jgi:hypothetical protein